MTKKIDAKTFNLYHVKQVFEGSPQEVLEISKVYSENSIVFASDITQAEWFVQAINMRTASNMPTPRSSMKTLHLGSLGSGDIQSDNNACPSLVGTNYIFQLLVPDKLEFAYVVASSPSEALKFNPKATFKCIGVAVSGLPPGIIPEICYEVIRPF